MNREKEAKVIGARLKKSSFKFVQDVGNSIVLVVIIL